MKITMNTVDSGDIYMFCTYRYFNIYPKFIYKNPVFYPDLLLLVGREREGRGVPNPLSC